MFFETKKKHVESRSETEVVHVLGPREVLEGERPGRVVHPYSGEFFQGGFVA